MSSGKGWSPIPVWIAQSTSISGNVKLLYMVLNSHVGERGCFPSQPLIAAEMGVGIATVKRTIHEMREMGLLEVRVERTPSGRRNNYRLLADRFDGEGGGITVSPPMGSPETQELEPDELQEADDSRRNPYEGRKRTGFNHLKNLPR